MYKVTLCRIHVQNLVEHVFVRTHIFRSTDDAQKFQVEHVFVLHYIFRSTDDAQKFVKHKKLILMIYIYNIKACM